MVADDVWNSNARVNNVNWWGNFFFLHSYTYYICAYGITRRTECFNIIIIHRLRWTRKYKYGLVIGIFSPRLLIHTRAGKCCRRRETICILRTAYLHNCNGSWILILKRHFITISYTVHIIIALLLCLFVYISLLSRVEWKNRNLVIYVCSTYIYICTS